MVSAAAGEQTRSMNSHDFHPGTDPGSGAEPGPTSGRSESGFFAWLRGLGITRSRERWFTGVAGGIATRAGIDPLIVRGIFVVLAILGGPGVVLYLAGWLLLPDDRGRIHLEEIIRGRASGAVITTAVIVGVVLIIPGLFALPWGWNMWGLLPTWLSVTLTVVWWAIVVPALVIWLIVWASRGGFARDAAAPDWAQQAGQRVAEWGEQAGAKAEAWGRDIDERSRAWEQSIREQHAARRLSAAYVVLTLACALLAAGTVAAWAALAGRENMTVVTLSLVAAVAVLGLAMIVAGLRGRNSGWVGFFAFVGVVALIFTPVTTVLPSHTQIVPFGNVTIPVLAHTPDESIVVLAGNITIDLESLDEHDAARTVDVWLLGGNVTVHLSGDHPSRVEAQLLAGNVRDARQGDEELRQGGIWVSRVIDSGTRGVADADITHVNVRVLGGNIKVEGGSASAAPTLTSQAHRAHDTTMNRIDLEVTR